MVPEELASLLRAERVDKINTANLGLAIHRGAHAATTVSATMELAAAAGVRVFATGGIGGVHRGGRWDVSADLTALARWPVAVVCSGVKSLLDVESTREMLETLGVPVIGFGTDRFPAFYLRESAAGVDARFDDAAALARFVRAELGRSGRGMVVANPIPAAEAIARPEWERWLSAATARAAHTPGRSITPAVLAALREISGGATLRANLTLVRENARLAARLAAAIDTA
jgi:pseudouridine-5'-phosphate glycosidase